MWRAAGGAASLETIAGAGRLTAMSRRDLSPWTIFARPIP
jgi:hypothetical protein